MASVSSYCSKQHASLQKLILMAILKNYSVFLCIYLSYLSNIFDVQLNVMIQL